MTHPHTGEMTTSITLPPLGQQWRNPTNKAQRSDPSEAGSTSGDRLRMPTLQQSISRAVLGKTRVAGTNTSG